jgi:hypothetical protein
METKTEALSELEVERVEEEKLIELGDALRETRGGPFGVILEGGYSFFKQG